ncbi:GspH/FimT family pseudopilin [Aromatoleum bremense]|nr:GspH/FimT family pseudopilin [Aromatoleum bremense]
MGNPLRFSQDADLIVEPDFAHELSILLDLQVGLMSTMRRYIGFSLIELMVTVAVLAIIAATAAPSFQSFLDKNRVVGAAEAIYTQMQAARSEAVKQSADMIVVFSTGAAWCSGFSRGGTCDCTKAVGDGAACKILGDGQTAVLKVVNATAFNGVTLAAGAPAQVTFDGVRGTVPTAETGSILFQSGLGRQMRVDVNAIGRVQLCSPSGSVGGYPSC